MKMSALWILWTVPLLAVWNQAEAQPQKHGSPSSQQLRGVAWWDAWYDIRASKPLGNVNWTSRGATDPPLLSRHGGDDNGPISTPRHFAERLWIFWSLDGQDLWKWHWKLHINPWNWSCRTRMIFSFNRRAQCKILLCHKCDLLCAPCSTAGSIMNLDCEIGHTGTAQCLGKDNGRAILQTIPACCTATALGIRDQWRRFMAQARRPLHGGP